MSLTVGTECLCSDGAGEVDDIVTITLFDGWGFQHEFSTVVIAVVGVLAGGVIDVEGFPRCQIHPECRTIGRYRHVPLGIESRGF